jgi:hypothetical protein
MAASIALEARAAPPPKQAPPQVRRYHPYVERGNSVPAPYALAALGLGTNMHAGLPTQAELSLSFAVGLTPSLWLDGSLGTLRVAPSLVFHSAQIGPNVLIVDTPQFELDGMVHLTGPSDDGRLVEQIEPALYAVAHFGPTRLDATLAFDVNPGPKVTYGARLPAAVSFQITDHVYGSVSSGVTTSNLGNPGETTAIPAGISLGWSDYLSGSGPQAVAISPSITFPELVKPFSDEPFRPGTVICGVTFYYVWKY